MTEQHKRKASASGDDTRSRILFATLATLKSQGIAGTSARAIARAGDFNQALIFYHFDSVNGAVIAAVAHMGNQRMERHRARLEEASSLVELIDIAIALHAEDVAADNMTALVQAFAGAAGDADMGPKLYAELQPWTEMVAQTIERVLGDSPVAVAIPAFDLARTMSALFLGIELLDDLDAERAQGQQLLASLRSMAGILETVLDTPLLQMLGGWDASSGRASDLEM